MTTRTIANQDPSLSQTAVYFDTQGYASMLAASGSATSDVIVIEDFRNFTFFVECSDAGVTGTLTIEAQLKDGGSWLTADTTTLSGVGAIKQVSGPFYAFRAVAASITGGTVTVSVRAQR